MKNRFIIFICAVLCYSLTGAQPSITLNSHSLPCLEADLVITGTGFTPNKYAAINFPGNKERVTIGSNGTFSKTYSAFAGRVSGSPSTTQVYVADMTLAGLGDNAWSYTELSSLSSDKVLRETVALNYGECPEGGDCSFPNLPNTNNFYDATCWLYNKSVLNGVVNSSVTATQLENNNILRKELANITFKGVYAIKNRTIPTLSQPIQSDNYPLIYSDLNSGLTADESRAIKALLFLEYGDGISPFDRNRTVFQPNDNIARVHVLKVLLETFNIAPNLTNITNPFTSTQNDINDMNTLKANNPLHFGYMRQAYDLGIITEGRPFASCKLGEAIVMLYRIMSKVDAGAIDDPDPATDSNKKYFEPLNITLQNLAMGLGVELGNFNHYAKSSFAMAGAMPMDFTHTYNSYNAELPNELFGMTTKDDGSQKTYVYQPLGPGWSHSYHSFITKANDRCIVHWGGGAINVYKASGSQWVPESVGVYDELSFEGTTIVIKTKSQIEYRFRSPNTTGAIADGTAKLWTVKDRNGNTLTINYELGIDNVERIASVTDGNRRLSFSYKAGTNLISTVSDPLGRAITFTYAPSKFANDGYILSGFNDAKNNSSRYSYVDNNHPVKSKLLLEVVLPKGNSIKNDYDANYRLTQSASSLNGVPKSQTNVSVASSYSSSSKTMSSSVQIVNSSSTRDFKYKFNTNNNITDINGNQGLSVSASYGDAANPALPTLVFTNSDYNWDFRYDSKGNTTQIAQVGPSGVRGTRYAYNNRNDVTSVIDPNGNTTYYDYDANGNLISVRAPEGSTTNIIVDSKGLPTSVTNPENIVTQYAYNMYGNLQTTTIPALSLSSTVGYDQASRVTSVEDFLKRKTSFAYDNNDNLLTETDAMNHATNYDYDANDNLTTITNAKGGVTSMTYDNTTDWLTSVLFGGSTKQYQYNNDGSLKTFTKPDGTNLNSSYDDLGRILNDGVNAYTYDSKHRLATIAKGGKTLTYEYDGFDQITGVTYSDFANNKVTYTYDNNGNVLSITYPGGKTVSYSYDYLNRMKTVTDWNNKTITYNYLKDSRPQSISYPNGMSVTYAYDNAGRQTGKTVKRSNGTTIASYSFTLDKVGNILTETRTESYGDTPLASETVNYGYNTANRITQAGSTSFTFDANGNTKTRGSSAYNYDALDKLTSGGGFNFEYDGLGNIRSNGAKRYMIDVSGMGNLIAETDMSGNPTAYYVYGAGGLEARILPNGTTEYYVSDYRGSVVAMTDATTSANITHQYQYDEFGKVVQKQETDENTFRYVGKYGVMYANDNLYYMRARFYDPTIGRFLSEDPIWSTNLYPYADNNPVMGIDPSGLLRTYEEIERDMANTKSYDQQKINQLNNELTQLNNASQGTRYGASQNITANNAHLNNKTYPDDVTKGLAENAPNGILKGEAKIGQVVGTMLGNSINKGGGSMSRAADKTVITVLKGTSNVLITIGNWFQKIGGKDNNKKSTNPYIYEPL